MNELLEHIDTLLEDSYDASDVPGEFYVVFTLFPGGSEETFEQLSSGVMEGVKGISGTNQIVLDFVTTGKNAILKMDGASVVRENKLSRVMYDNHHYIMSSDMFALKRLLNVTTKDSDAARAIAVSGIVDDFTREYRRDFYSDAGKVAEFLREQMWRIKKELKKDSRTIDSVRELARRLHTITSDLSRKELPFDERDWERHLTKAVEKIAQDYSVESEWIVKDRKLKIPTGSTLMIGLSHYSDEVEERYQEWKELKSKGAGWSDAEGKRLLQLVSHKSWFDKREAFDKAIQQYGLDRRYRVRFIDTETIKRTSDRLRDR